MANTQFTQELLDSLTEEERAGLLDPDLVDEGDDAAQAAVEGAGTPAPVVEPAKLDEGKAGDEVDEPAAAGNAAAAAAAAELPAAASPAVEPAAPKSLLPDWQLPADFEDRKVRIAQEEEALEKRFDDGELTGGEYRAQLRALNDEQRELDRLQTKAEIAYETRMNTVENQKADWFNKTVPGWMADHTMYQEGSAAYDALNAEVIRLQQDPSRDQFAADILNDAHNKVQNDMRRALGLPEVEAPAKKLVAADPGERELPPALGGLPNAEPASVEDTSRFAHISRLSGEAKENAMAALSDADRNDYLASPYA